MFPVAILAGGLATRLYPLTEQTPKALIEIYGRPFIEWQLKLLSREGIKKVVLCVAHKSEMIRDFVGDGRKYGIEIDYSLDGDFRLGTGGAIRKALPLLGDAFMVLYGDSYLPVNYGAVKEDFCSKGKPAMMTVFQNNGAYDASNVVFDGNQVLKYAKGNDNTEMTHIDYGLSIFKSSLFERYPIASTLDLGDVCSNLSNSGLLAGHEVHERFYEIGSMQGIEDFTSYIERNRDVL
jgi:hypothetical protein